MDFAIAAFQVGMSLQYLHEGPFLQISREYACMNIVECSPILCICCRGTEMFHEQTECVLANNSSLLRFYHIDHTEMYFLNVF